MSSTGGSQASMLTGIAIGAAVGAAFSWWPSGRTRKVRAATHEAATRGTVGPKPSTPSATNVVRIPAELREEQLSRHTLYFGSDGMESIRNAKVCVVGLGGVGSHTATMLARGGAEYLRLIDFDQVTLSSLNRHACATLQDVGTPKVTCVQSFLANLGLSPVTQVDARVEMYTEDSGPALLHLPDGESWDLVIDCIDDVATKAALLSFCICNGIRVYSCMGAGGKSDMTRLHVSDLRTASRDPLASKLRQTMKRTMKRFRQQHLMQSQTDSKNSGNSNTALQPSSDVEQDIGKNAAKENSSSNGDRSNALPPDNYLDDMEQLTIIYSSEKTVAKLADLTEEQRATSNKSEFGAVDGMRIRVLPVLGPLPAIMGQSLAAMALCELGDKPIHQPVTGERLGRNVRNRLFQHLRRREDWIRDGKVVPVGIRRDDLHTGPPEIDHDDVEYLMGVWRNRCGVTGARLGTVLELVRWDCTKPATVDNLVVMCTHALQKFDEEGRSSIPLVIQERIEKRLAHCRDRNSELF